ncbi:MULTISPECIES: hypothetical protein [Sporolactobacillus]|uniref:hypothetical protein n=1 Tax=Sporolactobacillus TaxID=2077 RepID=UPI0015A6D061|nr:hypothetical protein [Sporolactobacillus nakayamae]
MKRSRSKHSNMASELRSRTALIAEVSRAELRFLLQKPEYTYEVHVLAETGHASGR